MLTEIEQQVVALVGTALEHRAAMEIAAAPRAATLDAGKGTATIALRELSTDGGFHPEQHAILADLPARRRVLPLAFALRVAFHVRPGDETIGAVRIARASLLEDVAVVAHALAEAKIRGGKAFAAAIADSGYEVESFVLTKATIGDGLRDDGLLGGELEYIGAAAIWPPGEIQPEGRIDRIEATVAPQPGAFMAQPPRVTPDGTSRVAVPSLPGWIDREGNPQPTQVAVRVMSDLPPEKRGVIRSGTAAPFDNGIKLVGVAHGAVEIEYGAPLAVDMPADELLEIIAIYAIDKGSSGALLGTAVVSILKPVKS